MRLLVLFSLLLFLFYWFFSWNDDSIYPEANPEAQLEIKNHGEVNYLSGAIAMKAKNFLTYLEELPKEKVKFHPEREKFFINKCGMTLEQINDLQFDEHDLRYIWSRRCLYELAHNITRNAPTTIEKARALVQWIYLNVNSSASGGIDESLGIMPGMVLYRGYGLCDRSAQVFAEMCRQLKIMSGLYMFRQKNKRSPHTIAVFRVQDQWYFADTYHGVIYADEKGQVLSYQQARENPQQLKHYNMFRNDDWYAAFQGGRFYWVYDYRGLTLRLYRIHKELTSDCPAIYFCDNARSYYKALPKDQQFRAWQSSIKFVKQWNDQSIRFTLNLLKQMCSGGSLEARFAQISGFYDTALEKYTEVEELPSINYFFQAQCLYEMGRFSEAKRLFMSVLEREDIHRVHQITHVYLALIHEQLKDIEGARNHWLMAPSHHERVVSALNLLSS